MDLFFVLSGFLITRILIQQRETESYFKKFYARRALRIFPLYYLVLFLYFVVPLLFGKPSFASASVTANQFWLWTYLTNIPYPTLQLGDLAHFWSLAVEEHFYLFWPFVVFFTPLKKMEAVCLVLITGVLATRLSLYFIDIEMRYITLNTFCRVDTILFGCLLGILSLKKNFYGIYLKFGRIKRICIVLIAIYVALIGFTPLGSSEGIKDLSLLLMYSIFSLYFMTLIADASFAKEKGSFLRLLDNPYLQYIGKISYGIYILHLPMQRLASLAQTKLFPNLPQHYDHFAVQWIWVCAQVVLTIAASALSWHLFETNFIRLKKRFAYP